MPQKMLKKRKNTPAHLFLDDTPYFITAIIYQSRKLLADSPLKMALLELIQTYFVKFNWELHHWEEPNWLINFRGIHNIVR